MSQPKIHWPARPSYNPLPYVAAIVVGELGDAATTLYGLAHGGVEGNVAMRNLVADPAAMLGVKLGAAALFVLGAYAIYRLSAPRLFLAIVAVATLLPLVGNLTGGLL